MFLLAVFLPFLFAGIFIGYNLFEDIYALQPSDAETECRTGYELVFRIISNNYVCVPHDTAEKWEFYGISRIIEPEQQMFETLENRIIGFITAGDIVTLDDFAFRSGTGNEIAFSHNADADYTVTFSNKSGINALLSDITEGANNTLNSVGGGVQLNASKVNNELRIKSLNGSGSVTVSGNDTDVIITGVDTGEVNTASNVGSGVGVFDQKNGVDLEFNSLIGAGGISVTDTTQDITIDGSAFLQNPATANLNMGANSIINATIVCISGTNECQVIKLHQGDSYFNLTDSGTGQIEGVLDGSRVLLITPTRLNSTQGFNFTVGSGVPFVDKSTAHDAKFFFLSELDTNFTQNGMDIQVNVPLIEGNPNNYQKSALMSRITMEDNQDEGRNDVDAVGADFRCRIENGTDGRCWAIYAKTEHQSDQAGGELTTVELVVQNDNEEVATLSTQNQTQVITLHTIGEHNATAGLVIGSPSGSHTAFYKGIYIFPNAITTHNPTESYAFQYENKFAISHNGSVAIGQDTFTDDQMFLVNGNSNFGGNVNIGNSLGHIAPPARNLHIYEDTEGISPMVEVENDGTGDVAACFVLTGAKAYCFGIDNSDNNYFKFADAVNGFGDANTILELRYSDNSVHIPTGNLVTEGNDLVFDLDADSRWEYGTDDQTSLYLGNTQYFNFTQWGVIIPELSDAQRTTCNSAQRGMMFFSTTDSNLNICDGTNWILPDGTST